MDAPPPVSADVLAALPAEVLALIQWQARQIAQLQREVAELKARLDKDSTNSSLPPSSAHPHAKPVVPKPRSKRRRGGQPGHDKHERALIPVDDCQAVIPCVPTACRKCGRALAGTDPEPVRHQVWELPEIEPVVTEYRRHRLVCACGVSTCGALPMGVPTGQAGPRLIAFAGVLMACFRQSKRRAAQFLGTILNQPASAGWMVLLQGRCAEAVQPAYDDLAARLPAQPVLHIDESPTKEGPSKGWVWTFVADTFTFFACRTSRGAEVLDDLLGADYAGTIHCDRAKMYWRFGRLQWCWAHLKRDFQALIGDPCHTKKRLGHDLMRPTKELFALWKRVRDGTLSRAEFRRRMHPIRDTVEVLLLRGWCNALTHGVCRELWEHRARLWTFVDVAGVEPTNNAAERALRHAVIWRKLSFGTQSAAGSRFVERLLSVIETCRRQRRNAFAWLTEVVRAHVRREAGPSLLAS
ncbi:IS66 family transposase [Urbifossiella limnaea]|uniref:Transposase IS66 family protein n=1 Tax=Urbifossiella limnaea TaxID=2528023 RepID=A0A517XWR4_9BACT|nr:IS66 family transposase [Urbifossiella limnaea]QDU21844.1 Transposase IS66 family protein [Urbifossiella limnaea]QDU21950.1 Transposase IS66 family protein [Urbifossiella limnaea]